MGGFDLHKKTIRDVLDCLGTAFSPDDSPRPDVLGLTSNPTFMYAVEIETDGSGIQKLRQYKKQNAIKYVIFVDLRRRAIRVASLIKTDEPFPEHILEVVKKIRLKLFGSCMIVWIENPTGLSPSLVP